MPTLLGWIVLLPIPWITPLVYGLMLIKSCFQYDKCWVHPVLRGQRLQRSVWAGDAIICSKTLPKLYWSLLLSASLGHLGWLLLLLKQRFLLLDYFLRSRWKTPAVVGHMIVFVAVDAVGNVKRDMIWVGFGFGSNIGRFEIFLVFHLLFFFFCGHYSLIKRNGCNDYDSICCSCSY